jgi:C1A family cysteine protease
VSQYYVQHQKVFTIQEISTDMSSISLEDVKREIRNKGAKWSSVDQSLARGLESGDIKNKLGLKVKEEELVRLRSAKQKIDFEGLVSRYRRSSQRLAGPIASVDWRSFNGQNAVTSIKNQLNCGSCVAFGVAAGVESMAIIEQNKQYDLSEAELFFCAGPQAGAGACPLGGWWPSDAMPYLTNTGVGQENCFPYSDQQIPCNTCKERDQQAVYITENVEILDVDDRKKYISAIGPMIGGFDVFSDFMYYQSGVYSHVTGPAEGGHCIQVIGYDDNQSCWICKNSWGAAWGENGFFKMAYNDDDCGMDTRYPFWGVVGVHSSGH